MIDNLVTRFPNGVNNAFENEAFANLRIPDTSDYHLFYEDFDKYTAAQWVVGGAGTPVAPALAAGDGGLLSMVNSAADNDSNFIQQLVTAFTLQAGKKVFFRARATIDATIESDGVFGLQIAVAANNILTPADGLFIRKNDDVADVFLVSRIGGVETASVSIGQITTGVQFEVAFAYDGQGNVVAAFNGVVRASITSALTAVPLRVTAGVQNGSAAARTMVLDQLFCAKER